MKIIITAILVLSVQFAFAQDVRLAGVEYFDYLKAPVKNNAGNYSSSFQEFAAFASFPMQSKDQRTTIINGFQYALVQASVFNNASQVTERRDFQSITYNFSFVQSLDDKWKIAGSLMPSLASDFRDKLSSDDFFVQGYLAGIRKLNEFSSVGGGITYTTTLGSPLLLPVVYFRYNKGRQKVDVELPMVADYAYRLDDRDKVNVGFRMGLNGTNFHVSSDNSNSNIHVDKLSYSRINVGPVVGYTIAKSLKLEATGGMSVARKFEFLTAGAAKNIMFNSNNTGFFNISLFLVAPSRKAKKQYINL